VKPREPIWLTPTDVLVLHDKLLHAHGGAPGVRDLGLLESALARPRQQYAYGQRDLFALAAACAAGITRNRPFADGNKRTAFLETFVFLGVNGQDLRSDEAEVVRMMLGLADKSIGDEQFAGWLKTHCVRRRRTGKD